MSSSSSSKKQPGWLRELVNDKDVVPVSQLPDIAMEVAIPPESRGRGRRRGSKTAPLASGLSCEICGRAFRHSSNVREHQRVHSTNYKFECPVSGCGRKFMWRSSLQAHLRSHQAKLLRRNADSPTCVVLQRKTGGSSGSSRH